MMLIAATLHRVFAVCAVCCALVLALSVGALAGEKPAPARTVVLRSGGYWRTFQMLGQDLIGKTPDDAKPAPPDKRKGITYDSTPPPAGWMQPDFDDSAWARQPGPFNFGRDAYGFGKSRAALFCVRGKFNVTDPTAVKGLAVSLVYRGGVVIYINGKEIKRAHLKEGEITPATAAEEYSVDVSMKPDGTNVIRWGWRDPQNFKDRCDKRIRRLKSILVPAGMLRKGTNVLAIELHRSPVQPKFRTARNYWTGRWAHIGLVGASLRAAGAEGLVPNVVRPKGFQVWNKPIIGNVFDVDFGDPCEPFRPVRIEAAQNGTFSGQFVVGSDAAINGLKIEVGELKLKGGNGSIDKTDVQVRYPVPQGSRGRLGQVGVRYYDPLTDTPPKQVAVQVKQTSRHYRGPKPVAGAVQPVWVTVNVPADAAPGLYEGTLSIAAQGVETVSIPVELNVAAWALPKPNDFVSHADFVQSPETVAYRYNVPLWSDKHFDLIAESFKLLGRCGNKTIYIPLLAHTNHGNAETMVRWIKQDDGSWKHDFSIMEKYLDLYIEHAGKPKYVVFYMWEKWTGGGYFGRNLKDVKGVKVTVFDPATKKAMLFEGPRYDQTKEATAFLKPVTDGIRERLKERGLLDAWHLGCASDCKPSKAVVLFWKSIAPEGKWVQQGHGLDGRYHGVLVGYNTTVWKNAYAWEPTKRRFYGWRRGIVVGQFLRDIWRQPFTRQSLVSRILTEQNITGMQAGFGRMSADFWPCLKDRKGRVTGSISSRYPESSWSQCNIRMMPYFSPGPNGARSTTRYEMIVEGMQECEARIYIEKVLLDKAQRAKLGAERAKRIQDLLDLRTRVLIWGTYPAGWQDRSAKLYAAAAEVAKALGR